MASVFNKIGDIKNDVKQNSFDWSHDNNFTTDLGRITPVFTELVPPKSSLRIRPEFGLRFMPMMFPIQTKMKAYLSFFKVPLRTLWKDYMDFISSANSDSDQYEPPYMSFSPSDYESGGCLAASGLGDYFGIPTQGSIPQTNISGFSSAGFDLDPVGRAYKPSSLNALPVPGEPVSLTASGALAPQVNPYDGGSGLNYKFHYNTIFIGMPSGRNSAYANKSVRLIFDLVTEVYANSDFEIYVKRGAPLGIGFTGTSVVSSSGGSINFLWVKPYGYNDASGYNITSISNGVHTYFRMHVDTVVSLSGDGSMGGSLAIFMPSTTPMWNFSSDKTAFGTRSLENMQVLAVNSDKYPLLRRG